MNTLVKEILEYQENKNKLCKKYAKLTLIPKKIQFSVKDLSNSKILEKIVENFKKSDVLSTVNCLHCNVHMTTEDGRFFDDGSSCETCPYYLKDNWCGDKNSQYFRIFDRVEDFNDKKLQSFWVELDELGDKLEKAIKLYKERRNGKDS